MKKTMLLMATLTLVLGVGTAHTQQIGIDAAIRNTAEGLSASIGSGAGVAVLSMQAGSVRMSDYLIDETIGALTWLQGGRGFTTMNRAQFDQRMGGLHLNMAGPVDSATIQAVGGLLGVRYVVTGTFEPLAGFFRFRAQLIEVESAAVRGMHTADVLNDNLVAYLMGGAAVAATPAPVTAPGAALPIHEMGIGQFTLGQRWATWFLNGIPGLGSFVIMNDRFGGWFQVICAGLGFTFMIGSVSFWAREEWVGWGYVRTTNTALWGIGWGLVATQQLYNLIRSFTFGRNPREATVATMPRPWDIALVSGRNGIDGINISHTRRF